MGLKSGESRKKRQDELAALFGKAPIKQSFGMSLRYDGEGSAIFEMPYNPRLDHFPGGIHGGVIATLLDNAGWFTAAALHDNWVAMAELQARYLEPVGKVGLWSRDRILKAGSRLIIAEMEVRVQGSDLLVAKGSGTFTVTSVSAQKARSRSAFPRGARARRYFSRAPDN